MHDTTWTALEAASAGLVDADELMPRLFSDPGLSWMDAGLCAQADPEAWFPEKDAGRWSATLAKTICATCPVQQTCLDYALDNGEQHGVWGGLTERERRAVRRERRTGSVVAQEVAA